MDNLKKGKNVQHLIKIRDIAIEMKNSLVKGDLTNFSDLMNSETEQRKMLHKNMLPLKVKTILDQGFKNGAISAKLCGSGNGGSVLFYGNQKKLYGFFKEKVMPFKFDFEGLRFV